MYVCTPILSKIILDEKPASEQHHMLCMLCTMNWNPDRKFSNTNYCNCKKRLQQHEEATQALNTKSHRQISFDCDRASKCAEIHLFNGTNLHESSCTQSSPSTTWGIRLPFFAIHLLGWCGEVSQCCPQSDLGHPNVEFGILNILKDLNFHFYILNLMKNIKFESRFREI